MQEDLYEDALGNMDLATDPLTQNRYSLAGGNPVSFIEVDGHEPASSFQRNRKGQRDPYYGRKASTQKQAPKAPQQQGVAQRVGNELWNRPGDKAVRRGLKCGASGGGSCEKAEGGGSLKHPYTRGVAYGQVLSPGLGTVRGPRIGAKPAAAKPQPGARQQAPEAAAGPQTGQGVVYRRTDGNGGKPYVGQSKNDARYEARQQEHARENPNADFRYETLGRENAGTQLNRLEEYFIRRLGGPTNLRNPFGGLANRRHQMRDERYIGAGGGC